MSYIPERQPDMSQEEWDECMMQMWIDMEKDLGPLTVKDLPTEEELLDMARKMGCELPF